MDLLSGSVTIQLGKVAHPPRLALFVGMLIAVKPIPALLKKEAPPSEYHILKVEEITRTQVTGRWLQHGIALLHKFTSIRASTSFNNIIWYNVKLQENKTITPKQHHNIHCCLE